MRNLSQSIEDLEPLISTETLTSYLLIKHHRFEPPVGLFQCQPSSRIHRSCMGVKASFKARCNSHTGSMNSATVLVLLNNLPGSRNTSQRSTPYQCTSYTCRCLAHFQSESDVKSYKSSYTATQQRSILHPFFHLCVIKPLIS